ncbi:MAG: hypothetical protein Q9181_000707 [Wetmoreana brouardii]
MCSILKRLVTAVGALQSLTGAEVWMLSPETRRNNEIPDLPRNLTELGIEPSVLIERDDIAPGLKLRILPLGSSIVAGVGSSDGNGFRKFLKDDLARTKMQYVGSLRSGSMTENYHEGHFDFTIE